MSSEPIKDKDGKEVGTWEYDCATGEQSVRVLGLGSHLRFSAGTEAAELIKAISDMALPILEILDVPEEQRKKAKRVIDTVVKAAPGVDIDVWAGTCGLTKTYFCDETKRDNAPARYMSYQVFEGLLLIVHVKTGGVTVDSETSYVVTLIADGSHRCNCPQTGVKEGVMIPGGKSAEHQPMVEHQEKK